MNEATEADLMASVQLGDSLAYQQLLDVHLAPVSQFTWRMLRHRADAEDITQEVFIRLWQKAGFYDASKARLSTWLHQIAHNLCIDLIRKRKPADDIEPDSLRAHSAADAPLEHQLYQDKQWQAVKRAMQALPERQRSAIIMCHHQGLSNKQAAHILGVSVDALESLLRRGRQRLKTRLQKSNMSETCP